MGCVCEVCGRSCRPCGECGGRGRDVSGACVGFPPVACCYCRGTGQEDCSECEEEPPWDEIVDMMILVTDTRCGWFEELISQAIDDGRCGEPLRIVEMRHIDCGSDRHLDWFCEWLSEAVEELDEFATDEELAKPAPMPESLREELRAWLRRTDSPVAEPTGREWVIDWDDDWCVDCEHEECDGECYDGECEDCGEARRALALDIRHWERGRL